MENLVRIFEVLAWPITTIVIVIMLRSPVLELISTLKKLKYKDLELEFEKEAQNILAAAERDLPDPIKSEQTEIEDTDIRFSHTRLRLDPSAEILGSWRDLELKLRELSSGQRGNLSTGHIVRELAKSGKISSEIANVILELSYLRNKIAHSDEELISHNTSSSFMESVARVLPLLEDVDRTHGQNVMRHSNT
ncbi:hypothetical protein [Rheinheimera nanhaiensis]|uniref:hypothetical protein n=1 Tax=Rheinheimera nanhaiensis TaxID=1163621 RepID=UPI00069198E1|nr:hypothetical protein [Rheinheimera nanhaiensis]